MENKIDNMFYLFDRAINAGRPISKIIDTKKYFDNLIKLYESPVSLTPLITRKYHSFHHVKEGVVDLSSVEELLDSSINVNDVVIAWFYHDCSYNLNPVCKTNEEDSAYICFQDLIEMNFDKNRAKRIHDLIIWTKHKENPPKKDLEANLIVDIDLIRISCDTQEFLQRYDNVRWEYSFLDDKTWIQGRVSFWNHLLEMKKKRIFRTPCFLENNNIAIQNIQQELVRLKSQLS